MRTTPKHEEIARSLLLEIEAGRYAETGRLPSESQLVRRFGVSRPTAASALRDLQQKGLIDRRAGSGTYLRDDRNRERPVVTRLLGLLIPGLGTTEVFEAICGELATIARAEEFDLIWGVNLSNPAGDSSGVEGRAEAATQPLIRAGVRGVFFAPIEHDSESHRLNRSVVDRLRSAGIAVILLDRDLGETPSRSECDVVGVDNFAGGYRLADHLFDAGCRRLAFIARPRSAPTVRARVAGAREAIRARGGIVDPEFIREGEPTDPEFVRKLARSDAFDGLIAANDRTVAELLRTLVGEGISVPGDVRLVGFDDNRFARLLAVPLTTIRQPCREIATIALRTMVDRLSAPGLPARTILLAAELIARESTGVLSP